MVPNVNTTLNASRILELMNFDFQLQPNPFY